MSWSSTFWQESVYPEGERKSRAPPHLCVLLYYLLLECEEDDDSDEQEKGTRNATKQQDRFTPDFELYLPNVESYFFILLLLPWNQSPDPKKREA